MPLPREACKEYFMDPGPQDMPPGSDPQTVSIGTMEEPASAHGTEAISDTPSPYTGEGGLWLGHIHQVSYSKGVQNPTEIKLNA